MGTKTRTVVTMLALTGALQVAVTAQIGCWAVGPTDVAGAPDASGDVDTDGDADTEGEEDAATDADPDTDFDCTNPDNIGDWGGPCETDENCPICTVCLTASGIENSSELLGYCTPECFDHMSPDTEYCKDVSDGEEFCAAYYPPETTPPYYCVIYCHESDECPAGTDCLEFSQWETGICYPPEYPTPDAGAEIINHPALGQRIPRRIIF